ncbi:omptin family outer membrane protease (plasmid) [Sinorhizobium garamanticum]|uniref:Omptin family outer membrane protease n=1 Tax=Sinorhizobium garamanticum TaxID=680247 RepID=A0ABY8DNG1_9HYPH|nr:omptin family outer membrane protease [Sinorhizobium garamanticum]WEX91703.1 omptin family outer membrane protease [Sinorhizobium garamanticum]
MFCEYFPSLKRLTRPASQQHGETGPSTAAARSVGKSEARQGVCEAEKIRANTEVLNEKRGQPTKPVIIRSVVTSSFLMTTPSFAAADDVLFSSDDGSFIFFGGIGVANIKAQEFVYDGDQKISQLNWESKGVTIFTVGVDAQIDNGWSLKGSVNFGTGGNGHMVDTDWDDRDDWSDRSIHPNTELGHYVGGAIELDRIIYRDDTTSIAVGAGYRYTDVKWTAYGGSGIYSSEGKFRDDHWKDPDWVRGISYRQKVPVGFLSLSGEHVVGDLTISGALQSGLSFGIKDIDNHWLRNNQYHDYMDPAPVIGATVAVNYALTPATSLYLSGSFDWVFFGSRGDMKVHDGETRKNEFEKDSAGATFQRTSISFGLKSRF